MSRAGPLFGGESVWHEETVPRVLLVLVVLAYALHFGRLSLGTFKAFYFPGFGSHPGAGGGDLAYFGAEGLVKVLSEEGAVLLKRVGQAVEAGSLYRE